MIIGISGKQQSGKDFTGSLIAELSKENWKIVKFADKLKDIVCLVLGCSREQLEDFSYKNTPLGENWKVWKVNNEIFSSEKEALAFSGTEEIECTILTPRSLLQLIGTDAGRKIIHPNIWVNSTLAAYDDKNDNWIVTDVRFPNEADRIHELGGKIVRIERPLEQRFPVLFKLFNESRVNQKFEKWLESYNNTLYKSFLHESETGLDNYDNFDKIIKNNKGTKELTQQIKQFLKEQLIK